MDVLTLLARHHLVGGRDAARCTACGVSVWRRQTPPQEAGPREYFAWLAPDGRDWTSFLEGGGWVTYPEAAPACPPDQVDARCPWEEDARRYGRVWGDVQLETALRTWCGRHEMAVSDCPEPGPVCRGADGACMWGPDRCTGREDTCRCMCPACVGDTPDVWGYDGDH